MNKKPFLNALAATAYISLIASAVIYAPNNFEARVVGPIAPILFLSVFVFSAALMGYLFVYQPVQLMIEGKQKEATKFFITTVASFAGITLLLLTAWLLLAPVS